MDNLPQMGTAADMELRAARIADPGIDLKTKLNFACELREMLDTVRDVDSSRVLPHMIPALLEILRSGEAVFHKDSTDYQFRRVLLDILHRLPLNDVIRPQALPLFQGMLYLLRHDNEENGVTCCKVISDLLRTFRALTEELVSEFMAIFQEVLRNMKGAVDEILSEHSPSLDPNTLLPSIRSFKVLAEMSMLVMHFSQSHRTLMVPAIQTTLPLNFEVLVLEAPAQKKAREDFEAMGGHWTGMASTIVNTHAYTDFLNAQIKMVSFLTYVVRALGESSNDSYGDILALSSLRILQDCPANAIGARRELMLAFRHLVVSPYRRALLPHVDKLFNEQVLLGNGVGSRELLRHSSYAVFADLVHYLRNDLTPPQLTRIAHVYSRLIHNPHLPTSFHTLFAKMMFSLIEAVVIKDNPSGTARVLRAMLETCVSKLEAMTTVQDELLSRIEIVKKGGKDENEIALIEKARPVACAVYAVDKPEDVIQETRLLFRTFLHGFRACLGGLRKVDAPVPDGTVIFPLFEGCIRCMALFDQEPREANEAMEWFSGVLFEVNLHVFQEVWTHKIDFFFQSVQKRPTLLHICQVLFARDIFSPTLVAIVLKFLVGKLPLLGDYDDQTAVATIRLFKMAFHAVTLFPLTNEPILASYLATLIMDCFPLAAKASKPNNYFHLLRALFRAIGSGGGRFELLYKEVLPLLPEMLENMNRQLLASEGYSRDMIVELCLTVPLRLTHLLPHLTYLMQPLAFALRGSPELVAQGLRTLELCIDNLTPDFLDPTLNTVLRELTEALHSHLKPLPASHHHAHTTIRILGKLGGRNRRLLTKEPALKFRPHVDPATMNISFSGMSEKVELGPMSLLASRILSKSPPSYRTHAYQFMENCLSHLLLEGIKGRDGEDVFACLLKGVFDTVYIPEMGDQAEEFVLKLSSFVFDAEIQRTQTRDPVLRRFPSALFSAYLDAFPRALARDSADEMPKARQLITRIIQGLIAMGSQKNVSPQDILPTLYQLAGRFSAMCVEDSWTSKSGGCNGIRIMTQIPGLGTRWVNDRELDLVRTLLHILKDLPFDLPHDTNDVTDILTTVLRVSSAYQQTQPEGGPNSRAKLVHLVGMFFSELSSSSSIVRQATHTCIDLLVKVSGKPVIDLLAPHRERMLAAIYTKPLRALPFPLQIGMIEAVRYCISMEPPLTELNDELLRLLHETLGLADAEDIGLLGRGNPRQGGIEVTKLRVACIKLLTASMPMTDFFAKQHQTRQRVTGVYFKSLYSPSPEVKEVAHEGLRMVLTHQTRLPKELLQTGLRPILMNLADPKRLSVLGLEGLARLLGLLTNYFKVEIGHKLLDHFRSVSDPQMLQSPSRLPLAESDVVTKLVRLANIFHLLPSAANIFLEDLVNAIVQTEAHLLFSCRNPFSEPLGKYLDRYYSDSVDFFFRHLHLPRHLRTLRSILQAGLAPKLQRELQSRTSVIVNQFLQGNDPVLASHSLLLIQDLSQLSRTWIAENGFIIEALLDVWRSDTVETEQNGMLSPETIQSVILSIFTKVSEQFSRVDLIFEIVLIYTRSLSMDLVRTTHFLYRHIALSHDVIFQRNVLMRFLTWFEEPSHSWLHKAYFVRLIIIPTLLVHASRASQGQGLIDLDFVSHIHRTVWQPMINDNFSGADDMLKIELLYLTTVLVHRYSWLLEDAKKDIIKCAWHYITSDDVVVKQTAYLLAARFFEAFDTPQKFILRAWTGLLRPPHSEGRNLTRQALEILAPTLPRSNTNESGYPQWAKTTRRLLAEEGNGLSQLLIIYHIIVRQSQLFFPVRALFIPHMVNSLSKLGLSGSSSNESRVLSIDVLQVIFDWEQRALAQDVNPSKEPGQSVTMWVTPVVFRETMVSYLVRLATAPHDPPARNILVPRALALLQQMIGQNGWNDVTVKLNYFSKALEQNEMNSEPLITQALSSSRVLQIIAADKPDSWYTANATILQKLVRKGLTTEEHGLHDALHPIFGRLASLFPLPKEEDDQQSDMSEFHKFVYTSVGDGLRNSTALRGTLLMLKSVVQVSAERIEPFSASLMRLLSKLAKEHLQSAPNTSAFEAGVRVLINILDISQISVAFLGDQRRWLLSALVALVEKSKSLNLCRYLLDLARNWALVKHDAYPTMKEKASLLQKMIAFELRGDPLSQNYLELIYEIYTESSLRRSDLTTRLEQPFLVGCRARDTPLREKFIDLLDSSIPRSLPSRLSYILGVQSWEALADHNWIHLAIHLLLGAADMETPVSTDRKGMLTGQTITFPVRHNALSLIRPIQRLVFLDPQTAHVTWVSLFPAAWACLSRREQVDTTHHMISLLSKDYHIKQAEMRPNVIQTLLTGIYSCSPPMVLPPHLIKYLAKTYGAWHIALELLGSALDSTRDDESSIRETVYDSLAEVYGELAEEDIFYGLWRRRCLHQETNSAIAFEQNGMWEQALNVYESAQNKTRAGSIPFSEAEYCLWEDHWILSAEKLQQWDTLYELAKNEGNQELMLEAAWRTKDWAENRESLEEQINLLPEVATPRRRVFEAFIALLKLPGALDKNIEFTKILEDAMQLSLRKWVGLPSQLSVAHVPLLQHFQQFVELQEAVQIFGSLSTTNAQNLEKKSSDLKMVLQAWRERLPNLQDDISIWSDLVAWRQNVFNAINQAYIPLISSAPPGGGAGNTNTFGYRGYHETAWIINRFAHVARKHDLLDVCFSSLNKIYTLPNIEITEAFLKLREQARCHYQKPNDLQAGLEVINNTNLMYFSQSQKAEFYTLKGMFHARFGRNEEANLSFGQAVQMDMTQAKAWAEWGRFNDRMFKEVPTDMSHAANAVSCYLQAAGQYKSGKSRPLLARVLWLLSIDDNTFTISRAFDTYKGEAVFWYWITLTPQLCLSISQREVKQARFILLKLARLFPQALFFHLRTTKEDMILMKKQAMARAAITGAAIPSANSQAVDPTKRSDPDHLMRDGTGETDILKKDTLSNEGTGQPLTSLPPQTSFPNSPHNPESLGSEPVQRNAPAQSSDNSLPSYPIRQPWEYVEEVVQILKTASPLLILSMETMVDQISQKFKANQEEETYRLISMLLNDAISNYVVRTNIVEDDGQLALHTITNLTRMASNLNGPARKDYEEDFLKSKPTHYEYVLRLLQWRDKYEKFLDLRPRVQPLDLLSHYLIEFQYGKFDDIEIPGQYTEDKDTNQNFVRIQKFGPKIENCRSHGNCWRRFTLYGTDNSRISFSVQVPGGRHSRREEKVLQVFRTFNGALGRKKDCRKRNLTFHLPAIISCSPTLRLLQSDSSYISLSDVYEQHCHSNNMRREDPILMSGEKAKKVLQDYKQCHGRTPSKMEFLTLKKEGLDEVMLKLVPEDILTHYMTRTMDGPGELWRMRKQFGLQIASTSFMTYVFCLTGRIPSRFHLSRATGQIAMSELLPGIANQAPIFAANDAVPFRFTPNMQHFLGPIFTEGLMTSGIMAIARCLTEPEFDLEHQLCLFARDEVTVWLHGRGKPWTADMSYRANVAANIEGVVKRAEAMACKLERDQAIQNPANLNNTPVVHSVTNLISTATNPMQLMKMSEIYMPWF